MVLVVVVATLVVIVATWREQHQATAKAGTWGCLVLRAATKPGCESDPGMLVASQLRHGHELMASSQDAFTCA